MIKNYYQVLGVDINATTEDIKKAYRKHATKFHPDKHDGDKFFEDKFKELQEAYEILSDELKRAAYDRTFKQQYAGTNATNYSESKSTYQQPEPPRQEQKTYSDTKTKATYQPPTPKPVDEKVERRNRNIVIGLITGFIFFMLMQFGGKYGMHVPVAMICLFITIRQIFVVVISYIPD